MHAIERALHVPQQPIDNDPRFLLKPRQEREVVPQRQILPRRILRDAEEQERRADGDDGDPVLLLRLLDRGLELRLPLRVLLVEERLERPPDPEVALGEVVPGGVPDLDIPRVLHRDARVELVRVDDVHLGAGFLHPLDQVLEVEPSIIRHVRVGVEEVEVRQVGGISQRHGG